MKQFIILLFSIILFSCNSKTSDSDIQRQVNIIPKPTSVSVKDGVFLLNQKTKILASSPESLPIANMLVDEINNSLGNKLQVYGKDADNANNSIIFKLDPAAIVDKDMGDGAYSMQVTPKQITIVANKPRGLFYGLQSLLQLMEPGDIPPIDKNNKVAQTKKELPIPCVEITDYPRFEWRGLMLDVSRHFFSKEFVKKHINEMAKYKFNIFHFHLSDDQGWRVEIKNLPKLTEVGAWRVPRTGKWWSYPLPREGEEATDGGFYTQEDIKEIVQYAQDRFITVVPEIDVPGHSLAAITAYPELSCTKQQYHVNPGSRFYGVDNNTLCAGQEVTFDFMEKVLTEIAGLFPSDYIHIGGDECFKGFWGKCEACKKRMKENNLADVDELQSYFIKRMDKILRDNGKKLIGWDEILEGGLAPEATVMSWRGTEGGIKAAQMGHHVIMTPTYHAYIDFYQGDHLIEPETYSLLRLENCYDFEPVPPGIEKEYILGGQGNLWAESVPNARHAEYMIWPRALALSEVFWSSRENRDWNDFIRRMEVRFGYMDKNDINYSRAAFDPIISAVKEDGDSLSVKLRTEIPGLDIYYTFDETNPDVYSPKYVGIPLEIPIGASQIKVKTFRSGQPVGSQINCPLSILDERIESK